MPKIMADHNVEGHVAALLRIWTASPWGDFWKQLGCDVESFARQGIRPDMPDAKLWRFCQQQGIVLITGNRNAEGEESLEATIQECRTGDILPVLTIGNPARILTDRSYAEQVAERVLEFLLDLEGLRGIGRLYVP